jgi:Transposase DDE domain
MNADSLLNQDWSRIVSRLGGAASLATTARICKAFLRPRGIRDAVDLLRIILAYCLGDRGLRATAAWAAAVGLADISNPAILYRLRHCGDWLTLLIGQLLATTTPTPARGRLIRLIDASTVVKPGPEAQKTNKLWRVHAAFDLPAERFGHFELTDEHGGEQMDRIPVVAGEIRIGDRVYLQPDRVAAVLDAGGDVVVRAGWRNARWLDDQGKPVDLHAELSRADDRIDRTIRIGRKCGPPLALRLIAIRKPDAAAEAARRQVRQQGRKSGYTPSRETLDAASWLIIVTSLRADTFTTNDVLALYRLRWRIELGFKRLKSLVGLKQPPGIDDRSAKPWVLAHLLMILLLEPLVDALEDSPRWASAA